MMRRSVVLTPKVQKKLSQNNVSSKNDYDSFKSKMMCPNVTSLPIQGSYLEEEFQYVKLRITGCSERIDCADAEDYH